MEDLKHYISVVNIFQLVFTLCIPLIMFIIYRSKQQSLFLLFVALAYSSSIIAVIINNLIMIMQYRSTGLLYNPSNVQFAVSTFFSISSTILLMMSSLLLFKHPNQDITYNDITIILAVLMLIIAILSFIGDRIGHEVNFLVEVIDVILSTIALLTFGSQIIYFAGKIDSSNQKLLGYFAGLAFIPLGLVQYYVWSIDKGPPSYHRLSGTIVLFILSFASGTLLAIFAALVLSNRPSMPIPSIPQPHAPTLPPAHPVVTSKTKRAPQRRPDRRTKRT